MRHRFLILLWPVWMTAAPPELPDLAPLVESLFPLGGRPGSTCEVKLFGRNLEDPVKIVFTRPDLQGEVVSAEFYSASIRVALGPNVPTGMHEYRLITRRGTFVGLFHASSLPPVLEAEPNNNLEKAQKVSLPAAIDGIVHPGDYDVFRFHAFAGEIVILDVLATRASSRLDATVAVLDERGNELDFNDDYYIHKDAHLEFRVPKAGNYHVRVAETREGGSRTSSYRLIAGAVPYINAVTPLGIRRGPTSELRVFGFNLHTVTRAVLGDSLAAGEVTARSGDAISIRMTVPSSVRTGRHLLRVFSSRMEAPLAVPVLVSDVAERVSTQASSRTHPETISVPGAVTGRLDRRRSRHFYAFDVLAGEGLTFEVDGMKLGYLEDPVLAVYAPDGSLVASNDDRLQQNGAQPPNLDPYLTHTFEKAGRYLAMIRDSAERGHPNYLYRLTAYRAEPDFDMQALTPAITLYRGKSGLIPVRVRRLNGWDAAIDVWVDELQGLKGERMTAEPKDTIVVDNCALPRKLDGTNVDIPVHVAADAPEKSYPLRLRARGTMNGKVVEHTEEVLYRWESVGKITGPTVEQKLIATVTGLPLAVLETDESLVVKPEVPARLRVRVMRFDEANTPLAIELAEPLPGVKLENNVLYPGAKTLEIRLTASTSVSGKRIRLRAGSAVSPPIELKTESAQEGER